jgi:outer membrane protein assembly factor BamB
MEHFLVTAVHPGKAVEGGRVSIHGSDFPVEDLRLPEVHIGDRQARVVSASPSRLDVLIPTGFTKSGPASLRIDGVAIDSTTIDVAGPFATGLHQVDNPVFDADGNLFVTYSGTRGQEVAVSIFRVSPSGIRETFSSGIVNPTSMAIAPDGHLYVSSRFEGIVYRLGMDGTAKPFATDLGVACGLVFAPDGTLFVGDRSGTIFKVDPSGHARSFASLPTSVAAFHLALARDGSLYVSGPTFATYDPIYEISLQGDVKVISEAFGRPQGLAFDETGSLCVVEALAGASGLYRLDHPRQPELLVAGPDLIGVAFDQRGGVAVCSNHTAYRLPARAPRYLA